MQDSFIGPMNDVVSSGDRDSMATRLGPSGSTTWPMMWVRSVGAQVSSDLRPAALP